MDMVYYFGQMDKNILDYGKLVYNMVMDKQLKLMVQHSEESGLKGKLHKLN